MGNVCKGILKPRTFKGVTGSYCNTTKSHGFRIFWANRGNFVGYATALVIITSAVLLVVLILQLIQEFNNRPVRSETSVLPSDNIQLPSIAICNRDFFSLEKMTKYNVSPEMASYIVLLLGDARVASTSAFQTKEGLDRLMALDEDLKAMLEDRNMTLIEFISAISLGCKDVLVSCRFGVLEFEKATECCSYFKSVPTVIGSCMYVANNDTVQQPVNDEHLGLSYILKKSHDDGPELDGSLINLSMMEKLGHLQLTLLSNITHPTVSVNGDGILLEPETNTIIKVYLTQYDFRRMKGAIDWGRPECLPVGAITPTAQGDDAFYKTTPNCLLAQMRQFAREICNCTVYGLDMVNDSALKGCSAVEVALCHNDLYEKLGILVPGDISNLQDEKCQPVCDLMSFNEATSSHPIPTKVNKELRKQFGIKPEEELMKVSVFYPQMEIKYVYLHKDGMVGLIAGIGGLMALTLGCSLITLMEFVWLAVQWTTIPVRKLFRRISPIDTESPTRLRSATERGATRHRWNI